MFLNQDVELPYHGGLETEIVTAEDDSAEVADSGIASCSDNDVLLKSMGRKLADMGDEYLQHKKVPETSDLKRALQEAGKQGDSGNEAAYDTFKSVMGKAIEGTPAEEAYKALGAVLLTLHGLNLVGEGAKGLAKIFSRRFMEETKLDKDIERIGGLEKLQEVD